MSRVIEIPGSGQQVNHPMLYRNAGWALLHGQDKLGVMPVTLLYNSPEQCWRVALVR